MLLPIIMICVCALLGGGTLIFLKLSAKHKKSKNKDKEELAQITANEFVNVKDIRGNFLYTRDNLALAYLKIYPISTELFSKNEKRLIAKQLTVSLSSAQYPFQLLAVSRPVDISPLLSELSATLTSSSDVKQKELLKQEIVEMGAFALSGEVVERQFYIKIWDILLENVPGLAPTSLLLLEQLRTIDRKRLRGYIGRISKEKMLEVDAALAISIGIGYPNERRTHNV